MAEPTHPEAVVRTRRRAVGRSLIGTANALYDLTEHSLSMEPEGALNNDLVFIDPKEREALEKVAKALDACGSNLRKLAKRLGVE